VKLNSGMGLIFALVGALALNVLLFGSAALLSRNKPIVQDLSDPVAVNLVSLKPATPPPPPREKEIPKPKQKPMVDFTPQLFQPSLGAPGPGGVQVSLDPSLFSGSLQRGSFIFESTDLDQPPREAVRTAPIYPYRARQRNIEGWVKVKLLVQADGSVASVEILEAQPEGLFDSAVQKAVPQWKFQPGILAGEAVPAWVITTVRFELRR
jgi:periplasmic protein TonB